MGTLLRFALPATAVTFLSGLFLAVDTFFIARLGTVELAGATLIFPVFMIILTSLGGGIGIGISAIISKRMGRGGLQEAQSCVGSCLGLGLLVPVCFAGVHLLWGERLLRMASPDAAVVKAALDFAEPIFLGAPILGLSLTLSNLLRSERNLIIPAVMTLGGGAVNALLDPLLMFGMGPLPALGMRGAGYATVLGFAVSSLIGLRVMMGHSRLSLLPGHLTWSPGDMWEIIRIALPTILTSLVNNVAYMLLALFWAHFGTAAVAGYGLASRFEYVLILTLYGLGSAVVTFGGELLGASQPQGLLRVARSAGMLAAAVGALGALALISFPEAWFILFQAEPAVVEAGGAYFRVVALAYPFYALGLVYNYGYQTLARAEWGLLLGIGRVGLIALPGIALTLWSDGSSQSAALAIALSFIAYGLTSSGLFPLALRSWDTTVMVPAPGQPS
ncbi:MATE family efflux transporter [Stigmatella sp. ncwal1]|uniref:Multidrug-efflux transporter n=1 Tax=Stigmatella ashevillensis TaxID=2995309 RepID=A0ABT5D5E4_9BACT|nr:MATE family efflux transporter [Stigmatella ashevillena]MDC0708884.1 MATE family efflux transporter [Stigmatella ashevillena]